MPLKIDAGAEGALRHRPVRGRAHPSGRRPADRHGGRKSGHQPRRLRGQQASVKDEQLQQEIQSKPRGTLSRADGAVRRPAHHRGLSPQRPLRRDGRCRRSSSGRTIASTSSSRSAKATRPASRSIDFVGNHAYSAWRLKDVIKTSEIEFPELSADHRHLRSGPDRSRPRSDAALLPEARLCRRAGRLGDRRIRSRRARASSSPSRSKRARSTASARSTSSPTSAPSIRAILRACCACIAGDIYNGEAVEKTVEDMTVEIARHGYPFATVRPRGDRNRRTTASTSPSSSMKARAPTSSASISAATRARATT